MSALQWAVEPGRRLSDLSPAERALLMARGRALDPRVSAAVTEIISGVRLRGDDALREFARTFDNVSLTDLRVSADLCADALHGLDGRVRAALEESASAIRAFHAAQLPVTSEIEIRRGLRLIRRAEPLRSVGVYAPGGRASYPSSVLMGALPARVAGVGHVVLCSPPGPSGLPPAAVLAAASLAGVDEVYAVGGAGAIAALALGTQSIPRVDKVVGPGNVYVTEAKRQLNGQVGIDSPAGPSEVLILADDTADAELIALELVAQAEHDPDAAAVLVATSLEVLQRTQQALARVIAAAPRRDIVTEALARNGALLLCDTTAELTAFASSYAPEHLLVLTSQPRELLPDLHSAGTIFLGRGSSVVFGDYMTGANHVLPTGGLARSYAGLSIADFLRWCTIQEADDYAANALAGPTALLADIEGLPGHAAAARARNTQEPQRDSGPVVRDVYRAIELYDPRRAPAQTDLSDNTNLFGTAPAARRVLNDLPDARITRYPSVFADRLKEAIAQWHGVEPKNVVTGCGSDDVIDSAMRAFCERGDRVVYPTPTFSMVAAFAELNALQAVPVPLSAQLELPVDGLIAERGRVTYICNPNNPTGTSFDAHSIDEVAQRSAGVVLLDEAYADFSDTDRARYAVESTRVVSLRTLSKAFGLAGLRIGYAIGPARLIHEIEKSRGPYKVNGVAEAAALAVLQEDGGWVREKIAQTRVNRAKLAQALIDRDYRPLPSGGNFLCLPLKPGQSALQMATTLRSRGVAVRPFPALSGIGDCIRITIGPWSMMEHFLAELNSV